MWEIYPHAAEDALSEVMRFEADGVPSLVCRSSTRLCIAVNDHRSATYSVTMYNIEKRGVSVGVVYLRTYVLNNNLHVFI